MCKRKCFLLFFLIVLIPKVKELTALAIKQTTNPGRQTQKPSEDNKLIKGLLFQSSIVKVIEFILFDPEKLFTFV